MTHYFHGLDSHMHQTSDLHKHPRSKAYVSLFRETVMQLINKEKSSTDVVEKFVHDKNMKTEGYEEKVLFHRAVQCFWVSREHNLSIIYVHNSVQDDNILFFLFRCPCR